MAGSAQGKLLRLPALQGLLEIGAEGVIAPDEAVRLAPVARAKGHPLAIDHIDRRRAEFLGQCLQLAVERGLCRRSGGMAGGRRGGDQVTIIGQCARQQAEARDFAGEQCLAQPQVLPGARFQPAEHDLARDRAGHPGRRHGHQHGGHKSQRHGTESVHTTHARGIA